MIYNCPVTAHLILLFILAKDQRNCRKPCCCCYKDTKLQCDHFLKRHKAVVCNCGWRRGVVVSGIRRINEVNARRARLIPGWVICFGWGKGGNVTSAGWQVTLCGTWVPVAVWQPCKLLYTCYLLTAAVKCSLITFWIIWFHNLLERQTAGCKNGLFAHVGQNSVAIMSPQVQQMLTWLSKLFHQNTQR